MAINSETAPIVKLALRMGYKQHEPRCSTAQPYTVRMEFNDMIHLLAQRLSGGSRQQKTATFNPTWEPFDPSVGYAQLQAVVGPRMNLNEYELGDVGHAFNLLQSEGERPALRYMQQNARRRAPQPPRRPWMKDF